jgi:transcriptional regulator with XRE-family HTH domain
MTALPSVRRRILGAALRRYRQELGYSLDDAAHILECDRSKISRIETGQRGIRSRELDVLLAEYCVEKQTRETLALIADPPGMSGWRQALGNGLPGAYVDMIALEMAASHIMVYEAQQIPDLLQSDEYRYALASTSADLWQSSASACQIRKDIVFGTVPRK